MGLALVDRFPLRRAGPFVDTRRADQTVVGELLKHVRRPAADSRDHEDRRVEVDRDAENVVSVGGGEIDVGIDSLLGLHHVLKDVGDLAPLALALFSRQFLGNLGQIDRARIALLVLAVAEAHDFLLGGERVANPSLCVLR